MTRIVGTTGSRHRSRFLLFVPFALLMAAVFGISGSAIATTASCSNPATLGDPVNNPPGSAFEIDTDANLKVDTSGCIDWLTDGAGSSFRSGVLAKNDSGSGANDDSFGKGTAEDNPNPTIVTGSIPPNKSDLKAFGVFTEDAYLELFWSRVQSPQGTTNMDFELNKEFCDGTAAHCANNGTSNNPVYVTPKRTDGDKLITYDLSRGGTIPTISIRTWDGTASAWGPADVISGGASPDALGSVNTSTIPANETGGVSGGLTTALGQQDPFTFGETSISFEALFGSGACGTFGSAYLKSRSSDSFTAEIKDFVPPEQVQIGNCPSALTTTATSSVTLGNPISDTAHLNVPAGAGGTITFHLFPSLADCQNTPPTNEINTGLTPVSVSGPGDYNSGNFTPTATGTYYWVAVYSGDATTDGASTACGDANESSVVNTVPSSMTSAQSFIPNDSATISASAGGNLVGNVTFDVYASTDCTGTLIYHEVVPVSGASSQTVHTNNTTNSTTAANVSWNVSYDSTNPAQDDISAKCFEKTALSIDNDGTVTSP
jgi:hypothetical protein